MSLLDKLNFINNLQLGDVQSDDEMMVVPLIGELRGNVAPPESLQFLGTTVLSITSCAFENRNVKQLPRSGR